MNRRLEGRVAIVTGAAQGLGEAIAHRMAAEGCAAVTLADVNAEKVSEAAHGVVTQHRCKAVGLRVNVTDEAEVAEMVARTQREFGSVDILVANAGILKAHDVLDFPVAEWRAVMEVNLVGY